MPIRKSSPSDSWQRLARQSDRSAAVSLCVFRTDDAAADALDDFESFLYYVLRPNDLALRVDRRIVDGDHGRRRRGLRKATPPRTKTLQDTNRNRVGPPLPRFMTQLVGPWNLHEEIGAIKKNVAMLLTKRRRCMCSCPASYDGDCVERPIVVSGASPRTASPGPRKTGNAPRVLIVEDDPQILDGVVLRLESRRFSDLDCL